MVRIKLYTDGGCRPNPGEGAAAFAVIIDNEINYYRGISIQHGTNNIGELTAIVEGLEYISNTYPEADVTVITDSEYAKNGITNWMKKWKSNGWLTAKKKLVKNFALWQKFDILDSFLLPKYEWVKGHSGDNFNELVDTICTTIITQGLDIVKYKNKNNLK